MPKKRVNSRAKGIRGELEACKLLASCDFPAIRSQQHKGASDASDVLVPRFEQLSLFPEVKRVEQLRLNDWMNKCLEDIKTHSMAEAEREGKEMYATKPQMPVILHRRTKEPWFITMDAVDFLQLIDRLDGEVAHLNKVIANVEINSIVGDGRR
jgi:hypothetical protein